MKIIPLIMLTVLQSYGVFGQSGAVDEKIVTFENASKIVVGSNIATYVIYRQTLQVDFSRTENPNFTRDNNANQSSAVSETTSISYSIPSTIKRAELVFFDVDGQNVMSYELTARNQGEITLIDPKLVPGWYQYSIIADGEELPKQKIQIK